MADEKEAIAQFGSSDSGASLGDILGAALAQGGNEEGIALTPISGSADRARARKAGAFSYTDTERYGSIRHDSCVDVDEKLLSFASLSAIFGACCVPSSSPACAEENPTLKVREVEKIVDVIFDEIAAALERGDRVELRGFGAFSVRKREAAHRPQPPHRQLGLGRRQACALLQGRARNCAQGSTTGTTRKTAQG